MYERTNEPSDLSRQEDVHPGRRGTKAKRLTIAALVTVGLASGGVLLATTAAASGPGSDTGSTSSSNSTSTTAPSVPAAPAPNAKGAPAKPGPHIDGTVESVSGDTITVTDPDGFTRTIDVSSSTTYTRNGSSTDEDAVTSGRFVHAEGSVDTNGTSLDATSITVMSSVAAMPRPGAMPAAPGGAAAPAAPAAPGKGSAAAAPGNGGAPAAPGNSSAPAAPPAPSAAPTTGSTAHGS